MPDHLIIDSTLRPAGAALISPPPHETHLLPIRPHLLPGRLQR
jgi:hypothetical protein